MLALLLAAVRHASGNPGVAAVVLSVEEHVACRGGAQTRVGRAVGSERRALAGTAELPTLGHVAGPGLGGRGGTEAPVLGPSFPTHDPGSLGGPMPHSWFLDRAVWAVGKPWAFPDTEPLEVDRASRNCNCTSVLGTAMLRAVSEIHVPDLASHHRGVGKA